MSASAEGLLGWLEAQRAARPLDARRVTWGDCREWGLEEGVVRRRAGGFFTVRGVRVASSERGWDGAALPLIDQPEVGILGFLLRRGSEPELLVQAKSEPGNVRVTQLAPTVQATVSNYTRRHGGAPTPYLSWFRNGRRSGSHGDSEQSEQGTCFLGKYNRNVMLEVEPERTEEPLPAYRWAPVSEVLGLLEVDYALNTDARSVLASCDWRALSAHEPFADRGDRDDRRALLRASFAESSPASRAAAVETVRACQSRARFRLHPEPLDRLPGWRSGPYGLEAEDRDGFLSLYSVSARDREVERWQQPLLGSIRPGRAVLLGQRRGGALRFLLRASPEPGFTEGVQLAPTGVAGHPGLADSALNDWALEEGLGTELAGVRQSDEGGRFYRTVCDYRVVLAPAELPVPPSRDGLWLSLGDLHHLCGVRGMTSNELRSAVSLLLVYV